MNEPRKFFDKNDTDRLAEDSGLAIAIVDADSRQVSVSNNNSICRKLNPDGIFSAACSQFCGKALEHATVSGSVYPFECHAGLECRAVRVGTSVAIVGRTFLKGDNYRKATARAISGDWSQYPPAELFDNVLLTGSLSILNKTVEQVEKLVFESSLQESTTQIDMPLDTVAKLASRPMVHSDAVRIRQNTQPASGPRGERSGLVEQFNREFGLGPNMLKQAAVPETPTQAVKEPVIPPDSVPPSNTELVAETSPQTVVKSVSSSEDRTAEARAWRSFFGSLLKLDYPKAAESILEFLAHQYGLSSLIWLEKSRGRLENAISFGEMKSRKVRLGIAADDPRLLAAFQTDQPLELGERSRKSEAASSRKMNLFPIGVDGNISAAIAVLDPIESDEVKRHISRVCHSIAPQLEILRLRNELAQGATLSLAVKKFGETLKTIDSSDLFLNLTQSAAEMLRAERASLMVFDEKSEVLEIRAIVGAKNFTPTVESGERVAKIVFNRQAPVVVADVETTGLAPAPPDREYKTRSFLSSPLFLGGRTIGVMNFADKVSGQPFDRNSLMLFQAIAPQLAVAVDRAALKEKAGEFEQLSVTDALTGLLNRRYIEERLTEEIKRSNRHGFPMSFMMLDVDHFKSYNDEFGHPAGDEALKLVGNIIRETLRGADVAARFGGEEFAILLPQTTADEAAAIGERIRANVQDARFPHRKVTLSIGIASCSADLCTSKEIVSAADKALYEAKRNGRNAVLSYEGMLSRLAN